MYLRQTFQRQILILTDRHKTTEISQVYQTCKQQTTDRSFTGKNTTDINTQLHKYYGQTYHKNMLNKNVMEVNFINIPATYHRQKHGETSQTKTNGQT